MKKTFFEKFYHLFHQKDENDAASLPKNYFLLLFSNTFTKLGDTLSNPKTVLTWVMSYVNAPVYLISFIVPIRESGSMLPQIIVAQFVKTKAIRKWLYVVGSLLQFLAIFLIGIVTLNFDGVLAGWLIIMLLILFSFSRSICSISSKDVLGKTIPKDKRGKLKGYTVSISGILVLIAGLYLLYKSNVNSGVVFYSTILIFASCMWLIAAFLYAKIKESKSEISTSDENWTTIFKKISLLKTDAHFRKFIIARSLLLCSALSAPFYVLLAQKYIGKDNYLLGLFIIANGIASIISAPFWGKMADISSKNVMSIAASITSILGIFICCFIYFLPSYASFYWLYPIAFFILGIAHSGVRLGRKTYVVNMAEGNERTDYVSISNTIIGFILLITGGISALASVFSVEIVLLVLSFLGVLGAFMSYFLPNVEAE